MRIHFKSKVRSSSSCHPPENMLQPLVIQAVVFEMDGLLLNTEVLARRSLARAGQELGMFVSDAFCASLIGIPADASRRLIAEQFGGDDAAEALLRLATRYLRLQIATGELKLQPGAGQLLDLLDDLEMSRAVATSSSREKALHHLEHAGIAHRFDRIVSRDDVDRSKPDPDLHLAAARALRKPVGSCLALEDSYNGVRAANAAGMPVAMVPDLLPATPEMQQLSLAVLGSLHEVPPLIGFARSRRRSASMQRAARA
ncbi:conserved hypothetical protein [Burkholderiales bacterium 8X]|nr:conserved hypothetical protein [Burkholderiales bacterium 8X]